MTALQVKLQAFYAGGLTPPRKCREPAPASTASMGGCTDQELAILVDPGDAGGRLAVTNLDARRAGRRSLGQPAPRHLHAIRAHVASLGTGLGE